MTKDAKQNQQQSARSAWHWQPPTAIQLSPIMDMPPRPVALLKWIASYWLVIGATSLLFVIAWAVFSVLQPELTVMRTLAWGWVLAIWIRNLILLTVIAGALHFWFYIYKGQGNALKYDPRDLARDNGKFWFRDQVKDNMFWSLTSGVTIWTGFEVAYFWAAANGLAPGLEWRQNPVWFALCFLLIPIWSSFHFYLIHRALHWQPLYKLAHGLHHRNINVGPWSGIAMHPIEHLMYFSSITIHFLIPTHPTHVLFHLFVQGINPAFSHSGFDGVMIDEKKRMETGDFFHQLHHRHINCNYGTVEMPWDKVFGTFHDGTTAKTRSKP